MELVREGFRSLTAQKFRSLRVITWLCHSPVDSLRLVLHLLANGNNTYHDICEGTVRGRQPHVYIGPWCTLGGRAARNSIQPSAHPRGTGCVRWQCQPLHFSHMVIFTCSVSSPQRCLTPGQCIRSTLPNMGPQAKLTGQPETNNFLQMMWRGVVTCLSLSEEGKLDELPKQGIWEICVM